MLKITVLFILTLVLLLAIDSIWIGFLAKDFYIEQMGNLLRTRSGQFKPLLIPALLVYVSLTLGILAFVLPYAHLSAIKALFFGCLFGYVVYSVYDFTTYAIIANWSLKLAIIDIFWGTVACGITSVCALELKHWLNNL